MQIHPEYDIIALRILLFNGYLGGVPGTRLELVQPMRPAPFKEPSPPMGFEIAYPEREVPPTAGYPQIADLLIQQHHLDRHGESRRHEPGDIDA